MCSGMILTICLTYGLFYILNGIIFEALHCLKENIFILSLVEYKKIIKPSNSLTYDNLKTNL